jgi:hypothetical protein
MTRVRIAAAAAAILTALLLQATVVAPAAAPIPVSLPAVLVVAVALVDGPGTGLALGFAMGLIADLGSHHPAGVLALSWLVLGLLGGLLGRGRLLRDVVVTGGLCGVGSAVTGLLLVLVGGGPTAHDVLVQTLPAIGGDLLLALPIVALVRAMLRNPALRAPRPVLTDLAIGRRYG